MRKKQVGGGRAGEVVKKGEGEREIEEEGHMLWYIGLQKVDIKI